MGVVPLFVEIKAEPCENQGEKRHKNGHGHRAAAGPGRSLRASGGLCDVQTCKQKTLLTSHCPVCDALFSLRGLGVWCVQLETKCVEFKVKDSLN